MPGSGHYIAFLKVYFLFDQAVLKYWDYVGLHFHSSHYYPEEKYC